MPRKKIAIIEDHDDNREMMDVVLSQWYETASYPDGVSGLRGIRESQPDVVLLDIGMPGMDGMEVVRAIRSDAGLRDLPVIAVTAHAMNGDRERHLAAGFTEHISKPIADMKELCRVIERWSRAV